ncbi:MAG: hypothetical protein JJU29_06740 [Verrucomicrobia bacterium]|nr:hypothetical protein [Verrucomicrobiota bacterium]MCH8511571.1 hypothetical protein [Kiritimatiellia bacterium]
MKRIHLALFVCMASLIRAESPPPLSDASITITPGSVPETVEIFWTGASEHYYFPQISDNLMENWSYLPLVETGQGDPLSLGFATDAELLFYRLLVANHWSQEPMSLDFTGSGFSNWNFVKQGLNPFDPTASLRRMWVLEQWPINSPIMSSPVEEADNLAIPASLRLVSTGGYGMPWGTMVFEVESGPFVLLDDQGEPVSGGYEVVSDGKGRAGVVLRLNGFVEDAGALRATAGLDPEAPTFTRPITVAPGAPPDEPMLPVVNLTGSDVSEISWADSNHDPLRIRYRIYRDGEYLDTTPALSYTDALPTGWKKALYHIVAETWTGARSTPSETVVLRNLPQNGVASPGIPQVVENARHRVTLTWTPGMSDHGIAGYRVRLNGQWVASTPDNRWTFTNLPPGVEHEISVQAVDQRGEFSAESAVLTYNPATVLPKMLAPGGSNTLWLETDGQLYSSGSKQNNAGGLHAPSDPLSSEDQETFVLPASYFDRIEQVISGELASLLLWENGLIFQMGTVTFDSGGQFTEFVLPIDLGSINLVRIGAGYRHFFAVEETTGQVWSWGVNEERQLGRNTPDFEETLTPGKVEISGGMPLEDVERVEGGRDFSVALLTDGTLRTWGLKSRLGCPDNTGNSLSWDHPGPVRDAASQPLANLIAIAAGASHTLALDENGEIWSFGDNSHGQLGHGSTSSTPVLVPARVRADTSGNPVLGNVVAIAAGEAHSLALDNQGRVWSFGEAVEKQLGYGTSGGNPQPYAKLISYLDGLQIIDIAAGPYNGFAVDEEGRIFAWGLNLQGQLGDGTIISRWKPEPMELKSTHLVFTPYKTSPTDSGGVFISTARLGSDIRYTLDGTAVTATSPLLAHGSSLTPAPGTLIRARAYAGTMAVGEEQRWRVPTVLQGALGDGIAVFVGADGQPHAWGRKPNWQPGDPVGGGIDLGTLGGDWVHSVSASGQSVLARTYAGDLYGWGGNENGILLPEGPSRIALPLLDPALATSPIRLHTLSAWTESGYGGSHRLLLNDQGQLRVSGVNDKGQLGLSDGPNPDSYASDELIEPTVHPRVSLGSGTGISCLTDGLGNTRGWGNWRLAGRGLIEAINPSQVADWIPTRLAVSNVVRISSGKSHSLALRGDGSVWAWGLVTEATTLPLTQPVRVRALTAPETEEDLEDVIEVAAGYRHALALRADGTVWSWGSNVHGELGYADSGDSVARQVPGLSNIHWIAAGKHVSMAGKANGEIWAWGRNSHGELGDPQLPGGHTPVLVGIPAPVPLGPPYPPGPSEPPPPNVYSPPSLEGPDPDPGSAPEIHIESPTDLLEIHSS